VYLKDTDSNYCKLVFMAMPVCVVGGATPTYFCIFVEDGQREVYEYETEAEAKELLIHEIASWTQETKEDQKDPELVEFYMSMSIEKLAEKTRKFPRSKCVLEKVIIGCCVFV
jgi:hypothetical protein